MAAGDVDEAITYTYDLNDRLLTELKDVDGWADDRLTVYGYDGTQQTSKSVHATETDDGLTTSDPVIEQTDYTYNLQGRMDSAEVSEYDSTGTTLQSHKKSTYEYDDSGIRVAKTELVDVNNDGDFDDAQDTSQRTDYHVDKRNPTGYAQVLEEMHGDMVVKSYTIGHDVFLEAVAANQARRLLKDGHGSTRMLVDALGNVISGGSTPQVYAYDAYGLPIGFDLAAALTTHLYSGELTDQLTGLQYLRARYYNPATGTFNRLDPFAGNFSDPQSLHKYLYCHADAVNGIDPSGEFIISLGLGAFVGGQIQQGKNRADLSVGAKIMYGLNWLRTIMLGTPELFLWNSLFVELAQGYQRTQARGSGGLDITNTLIRSADEVGAWWQTLTPQESVQWRKKMWHGDGWDIANLALPAEQQRFHFGVPDWAPRSVSVDGNVYYAHEVNYFIWGFMNAEASKNGDTISKDATLLQIWNYRFIADAFYGTCTLNDGTKTGRSAWAAAGWDYSITGNFQPPTNVRLPNATATSTEYAESTFQVSIRSKNIPPN